MRLLKQSSTSHPITFYLVDAADLVTAITGASPTVTISKNGAAFAAVAGSVAEIGNGWYKLTPAAGDVDTLGPLVVHATANGAVDFDAAWHVVAFDPHNGDRLGLTALDAMDTDGTLADNAVDSGSLTTSAKSDIASAARSEMDANSTQLAAIVADTNELQTDWADGGRLDVLLDASGTVVLPTGATVPSRGDETSVSLYLGETISTSFTITDASGDPVDLSGKTLELAVETLTGTDVTTIADGSITISGASSQTATVTWPSAVTESVRTLRMFLRDTANGEVLIDGKIHVDYAAETD